MLLLDYGDASEEHNLKQNQVLLVINYSQFPIS